MLKDIAVRDGKDGREREGSGIDDKDVVGE